VEVSIVDFAFSPAVITVTAGTVVTWTNQGEFAHTTTSDVGSADPWDSGILGPGAIFTRTFDVPGVFGYFCGFHPMQGTVVVLASQQAPLELSVTGPSAGAADRPQTFAAAVSPITTTQPVTYSWQATGQAPITHINRGLSDTLAFTWSAADVGLQVITVTADNSVGTISATYTTTIVPPAGEGVTDVSIVDFAFQPWTITISVGSSVRWINAGLQPHTTTSDVNSSEVWDSGNLDPGDVFTRTFDARGVYEYLCTIHPDMTGVVAVVTQVYLPLVLR
jgi:plastocyanin